jgi:hypothetical protein
MSNIANSRFCGRMYKIHTAYLPVYVVLPDCDPNQTSFTIFDVFSKNIMCLGTKAFVVDSATLHGLVRASTKILKILLYEKEEPRVVYIAESSFRELRCKRRISTI